MSLFDRSRAASRRSSQLRESDADPQSVPSLEEFDARDLVERMIAGPTTPERSLRVASTLFEGGACGEAYAVLVYGLSLDCGDALTTELLVELLPLRVLDGLAGVAEARGDHDLAGILEAVACVSAGS
jgi:hypothetical protein